MNQSHPRQYRFSTAAQWAAGLLQGLHPSRDALVTAPRYQRRIRRVAGALPATKVAANSAGAALWEIAGGKLQRIDEFGGVGEPDVARPQLLASSRWIADRNSLWLLDRGAQHIARRAIDTNLLVDIFNLPPLLQCCGIHEAAELLDIAADGDGGVWILLRAAGKTQVLRIDCHGRVSGCIELGHGACQADQLGFAPRSRRFVMLSRDGERLTFYNERGEPARTALMLAGLVVAGWKATRIAADGADAVVLIGRGRDASVSQLLIVDCAGELLDGPLAPSAEPGAEGWQELRDVAARHAGFWLAADTGVFRMERASHASSEFDCAFLTPPLESPEVDSLRGWLRAELDADLPEGAAVEARFGWTKDAKLAVELRDAVRATGLSIAERRALVWSRLDAAKQRTYSFTAEAADSSSTIAIPLFEATERYLWLEVRVVAPPNSTAVRLRELRVLYPDVSLMQHLPAIYSDARQDPEGAMRRIVGVIEATSQRLDERIRGITQVLDPARAPSEWLDYMAQWFDLPWDPALSIEIRRALLRNAATLIAQRGTAVGLQALLDILFGAGNASFVDLTAEVGSSRLGGCDGNGASLPLLLAGAPLGSTVLGEKAVIGGSRLPCDSKDAQPEAGLAGLVRLRITAAAETRAQLGQLLPGLLDRFLPAAVFATVRWRETRTSVGVIGESYRLEGRGPARVGEQARLGNLSLAGALPERLAAPAMHVRLQL